MIISSKKRLKLAALLTAATALCGGAIPAQAVEPGAPLPSIPTVDAPAIDAVRSRQYWLESYGFSDAWKTSRGEGVTVAVIDTGVDGNHQDLSGNVLPGYDASGVGSENGWKGLGLEPEHGTLAASVIAGHGHKISSEGSYDGPGEPGGVIGIAPEAKILPISLELGTVTPGGKSIDEQLPDAVRYAVDHGAKVINLSVGSGDTNWPQSWDEAFAYAEEKGVVIVAAAGNRGSGLTQVGAPATMPGVLSVGGVDQQRKASWASSSEGISIAVAAPAEDMIGATPRNKYALWSGSSASAPVVSGLAALIIAEHPELNGNQVIQRIISSADDAGKPGRDPLYGFGIINPVKALGDQASQDAQENPLGSMRQWMSVHRKASQAAEEQPTPSATPVHEAGETIPAAAPPQAHRSAEDSGILPFIVLGGFALWVALLTGTAISQLKEIGRRR